ncbi:unnamed protein product [Clavelina lepadiformis]|uniref:Uncharacterized protein n=1 Tax=Clavelina lepadiformis TaxID=159417 RepID=A0ABP0GDY1_CLALP
MKQTTLSKLELHSKYHYCPAIQQQVRAPERMNAQCYLICKGKVQIHALKTVSINETDNPQQARVTQKGPNPRFKETTLSKLELHSKCHYCPAIQQQNQLVGVINHLKNDLKEEKAKFYLTESNLRDELLQHMNQQVVTIERKVARLERREDVLEELYSTKIPHEEDELGEKFQENTLKLDCEISNDEMKNVVQNLAKGKSPGPNGIRGEFYMSKARLERREDVLEELYSTKIPHEEDELGEKFQENTLKLDCEISNDEMKNVVQNLAKGKSPGPNGIRGEFYMSKARLERREDVLEELYSTKIPHEEDELGEKFQCKMSRAGSTDVGNCGQFAPSNEGKRIGKFDLAENGHTLKCGPFRV